MRVVTNADGTKSVLIPESEFAKIEQVAQELVASRALIAQYREQIKQAETVLAIDKEIKNLTDQEREARKAEIKDLREAVKLGQQVEKGLQSELTRYKQKYYLEKLKFYGAVSIGVAGIIFLLLRK